MSATRPSKKRAIVDVSEGSSSIRGGSLVVLPTPPPRISNTTTTSTSAFLPSFVVQQQLETVQAELDHERSMRLIDERTFQQDRARWEQLLEATQQQATQAEKALAQYRQEAQSIHAKLRESNAKALAELRACQIQIEEMAIGDEEEGTASYWQEQATHLENLLQTRMDSEEETRKAISEMRTQVYKKLQEAQEKDSSSSLADGNNELRSLEEAPPAVMQELNRVRIALAESERRERQLQRQIKSTEQRNQQLIVEREEAKLASERLEALQTTHAQVLRDFETASAENRSWKNFSESISAIMAASFQYRAEGGGPPEVSSVVRFLKDAQDKQLEAEGQQQVYAQQLQTLKQSLNDINSKLRESETRERQQGQEIRGLEKKLETSQLQVRMLEAQQGIYQKEADNLRSLINTMDDLPLPTAAAGSGSLSTEKADSSTHKALELSLNTVREELKLVKEEKERLSKAVVEHETEFARIQEKFNKLKEVLYAERAKVEQAEQRANEAEALAGKGSFNLETSRVLHLKETPLTEALREEVKVLQRQLEQATKTGSSSKLAPDPDKLNQRLKQNFKEQIALFREGVYLMTGFKVDMLPGTDRPTFRVRSMYAEREEDHLLLKWPKKEPVTSLDVLNTDFAKLLVSTPSYDYMTKFHSLPAFLASIQLALFEKQTIMV